MNLNALCVSVVIGVGAFGFADKVNDHSIGEIRNYRAMFRVNQKPVDMVESTKFMCAPPSSVYGPHYDLGVVYYVNEIARQGLKEMSGNIIFPLGSIIVKEKQERKTEDSVQIITVMRKVRPDHSEDAWEFKMYDVKKWTEIDSSRSASKPANQSCIGCHRRFKDNDYISDKGMELLRGK